MKRIITVLVLTIGLMLIGLSGCKNNSNKLNEDKAIAECSKLFKMSFKNEPIVCYEAKTFSCVENKYQYGDNVLIVTIYGNDHYAAYMYDSYEVIVIYNYGYINNWTN